MRLELYIRGCFYISEEITLPGKSAWMNLNNIDDFEVFCNAREGYVAIMIRGMLNRHSRAIGEYEWEIRRIFQSKVNFESELEPQLN